VDRTAFLRTGGGCRAFDDGQNAAALNQVTSSNLFLTLMIGLGFSSGFSVVASVNFMCFFSRKGAHAIFSSVSSKEIGVREVAKKCVIRVVIRLL